MITDKTYQTYDSACSVEETILHGCDSEAFASELLENLVNIRVNIRICPDLIRIHVFVMLVFTNYVETHESIIFIKFISNLTFHKCKVLLGYMLILDRWKPIVNQEYFMIHLV